MTAINAIREELLELFNKLSAEEQSALVVALRKQMLMLEAERLSGAVKDNAISEDEIVEEVKAVRKALSKSA